MNTMKNTKLRMLAVVLITMALFTFSACGNQKNADTLKAPQGTSEIASKTSDKGSQVVEVTYPLVVKDANGIDVTIAKKPEKIVSLTLATDELLFSIVEKSRIKAITNLSTDPILSNVAEKAKEIPLKLGSEAEKIISLQPDIVLLASWADKNFVKQLTDAKITVYSFMTPNNIEEVRKFVTEIAKVTGDPQKGAEVIKDMDQKLSQVAEKLKSLPEDKKLSGIGCDSFFYAYGENTTFDDIQKKAGMINAAAKAGLKGWQQISKEKIIEYNPDIIFLPSWSYEKFDAKKFVEDFKNDKSVANIKAVKNNKVLALPEKYTTSTSQYIVDGVVEVAKAVYPELFK